jgi:hypothetical protein
MKFTVRTEAGPSLDPRRAEALAAPALAALQQEIDSAFADDPSGRSDNEIVRETLERLRERGLIFR